MVAIVQRDVEPMVCVYLALNRPRVMVSVNCFIREGTEYC